MDQPLVSLITVNFNQTQVTKELLFSLRKVTYPQLEIIVVDNHSTQDDPTSLKEEFPEITFIKSEKNLGFAGGNNLGIAICKGAYCLFLNNDTEVEPDFLEPIIQRFQSNSDLGMVSPKIKFYYHRDKIQFAGYTPYHPVTLRQHLVGYREIDQGQYDKGGYTFAGHGAAMMVPKNVIDLVGMMTEQYFLYYEEHDWCERIKRAGFKVYYEPNSVVWHKESISTGKESPLKAYYLTRNRIVFTRRNIQGLNRIVTLFYLYTVVPVAFTIRYLSKGSFGLLAAAIKGTFWNWGQSGKKLRSM